MIYTCTMNPAIDHFIETDSYVSEDVNRTNKSELQPNGKGVNISFVLKKINIDNTAIGFAGGFTGEFIDKELRKRNISTDFIEVEGVTRVNVFTKVLDENTEYKLVNKGPQVCTSHVEKLLEKIKALQLDDMLFVSGSLPKGVEENIFVEIAKLSKQIGFKLVLDISSDKLLDCLPYNPYCIKPNDQELASWYGKDKLTNDELTHYGKELVKKGAQNVLVSLGGDGCLYFDKDLSLHSNAPSGTVVNTACSGDTLLATFIGSLSKGKTREEALKTAVAAGSSTAFTTWLTDFSDVEELKKQIKIEKIS